MPAVALVSTGIQTVACGRASSASSTLTSSAPSCTASAPSLSAAMNCHVARSPLPVESTSGIVASHLRAPKAGSSSASSSSSSSSSSAAMSVPPFSSNYCAARLAARVNLCRKFNAASAADVRGGGSVRAQGKAIRGEVKHKDLRAGLKGWGLDKGEGLPAGLAGMGAWPSQAQVSRQSWLHCSKSEHPVMTTSATAETSTTTTTTAPVTIEFQRQKAKELVAYFEEKKYEEKVKEGRIFGWTRQNEINNGRWTMFGIAVGLLTEYATGVSLVDQIKIIISNLGIADI